MHGLMKRGVIIISLLIISCLSFVGCGKKYISETKNMALPMTELRLGEANSKVEEILGKPDEDLSSESSSHLYYKYNNFKWKGKKGTLTVASYDKDNLHKTVSYVDWKYTGNDRKKLFKTLTDQAGEVYEVIDIDSDSAKYETDYGTCWITCSVDTDGNSYLSVGCYAPKEN